VQLGVEVAQVGQELGGELGAGQRDGPDGEVCSRILAA